MKNLILSIFILSSSIIVCTGQPLLNFLQNDQHTGAITNDGVSINAYYVSQIDGVQQQNVSFSIQITNLPVAYHNGQVRFILQEYGGNGNVGYQGNVNVNAAGVLQKARFIGFLDGVFEIELQDIATNAVIFNSRTAAVHSFLIVEKNRNIQIAGVPYDFMIRWCDSFFPTQVDATNFVNHTEIALNTVWQEEVNNWNLCNGLAGNIPNNGGNSFYYVDINWANRTPPVNFMFHEGSQSSAIFTSNERKINVMAEIIANFNNTANILGLPAIAITEQEFLYCFFSHEFFHGIQASHVNYDAVPNVDFERRKWLIEGQAKFIETVFMSAPAYNTTIQNGNACYTNNSLGSYAQYTSNFINNIYDDGNLHQNAYRYPSLHDASYKYAVFWRHLFEHNFPANTPIADKMALLRTTCISNTTSVLAQIETNIMDANLNDNFNTFDEALIDFTERLYFHDNIYNNWDDANPAPNDDFYDRITNFNPPAPTVYNGPAALNYPDQIPSSFAHRVHKFSFTKAQTVKIHFQETAAADDFHVRYFIMNGNMIEYKNDLTMTGVNAGTGEANICIGAAEELLFLVTRLDANEPVGGNYTITLTEVPATIGYNWPLDNDNNPANGLVFNTQHDIVGQFADCRSNGAVNIDHYNKGIDISAPVGTNVYSVECGTAYVAGSSVNIGKFRYNNLIIPATLTNGKRVNQGDLIGTTNADYLNFTENDITLIAPGEPVTANWLNPLRINALTPYIDKESPVINDITILKNTTSTSINSPLYGKLDIVVNAHDPATKSNGAGDPNIHCGIYKIKIQFFDIKDVEIPNSEIIYHNTGYNNIPKCTIDLFYATGSTSTNFLYLASNDPYNVPFDKYWNTRQKINDIYTVDMKYPGEALFKDGRVKIKVTVEDIKGNSKSKIIEE